MKTFKPVDLKKVRTSSLKDRKSLIEREKLGTPCKSPVSFKNFLQSLPDILAARDFKEIVRRLTASRKKNKVIL